MMNAIVIGLVALAAVMGTRPAQPAAGVETRLEVGRSRHGLQATGYGLQVLQPLTFAPSDLHTFQPILQTDERVMAFGVQTTLEITGDTELLKRAAAKHLNPRPFMRQVGVLGMSSAVRRLQTVLKQSDDAVRSGRLAASLNVGPMGQSGNANTVFDLSNSMVTVGTNLIYAAQVHFGGTIMPKNAKALAIPLIPSLQRNQIGPTELDPTRELLQFIPITGNKPNVFGLLINPEVERTGKQKRKRGALPKVQGIPSIPPGPVYVLAWWVTQPPRPYLYWSDEDKREIGGLWKRWLSTG